MDSTTAVEPLLEQIVARIVEQAQPEKVILFGSRARGDARSSSDFDILVIKECDESRARREVPLYRALAGLWADVDIIVYTPEEVLEWSAVPQAFVTTAVREGKVLYERKPCVKAKAGSSMKQKADLVRGWLRRARSDLVAKYFRGLGDPTRVRILELLRDERELTVGELVERLALPQPKVSNHLACLRWCGFVEARREHRTVYNRIADPRVLTMLSLGHALLEDNAVHVAACCRIDE